MSEYLVEGSWLKTPDKQRRKALLTEIKRSINDLDKMEGCFAVFWGKDSYEWCVIGRFRWWEIFKTFIEAANEAHEYEAMQK